MQNTSKPGIDIILKDAFRYWNSTLLFQIIFSLIYFSIFIIVFFTIGEKYGIIEQYISISKKAQGNYSMLQNEIQALQATSSFMMFSWWILGTLIFLYPLNIGFYQIYRKIDVKEDVGLHDLFAGYKGVNFIKFISFYLFWFIIYSYTISTFVLAIVWVFITIFSAPLMFFMNKTILETISLNFKVLKMFFVEITVCVIIAFLFKYAGLMVFLVGFIFTFPFWNAMIYSMYQKFFTEKE